MHSVARTTPAAVRRLPDNSLILGARERRVIPLSGIAAAWHPTGRPLGLERRRPRREAVPQQGRDARGDAPRERDSDRGDDQDPQPSRHGLAEVAQTGSRVHASSASTARAYVSASTGYGVAYSIRSRIGVGPTPAAAFSR